MKSNIYTISIIRYIVITEVCNITGGIDHDTTVMSVNDCVLTTISIYFHVVQYISIKEIT